MMGEIKELVSRYNELVAKDPKSKKEYDEMESLEETLASATIASYNDAVKKVREDRPVTIEKSVNLNKDIEQDIKNKQKQIAAGIVNEEARNFVRKLRQENNKNSKALILANLEVRALQASLRAMQERVTDEAKKLKDYIDCVHSTMNSFNQNLMSIFGDYNDSSELPVLLVEKELLDQLPPEDDVVQENSDNSEINDG